MALSDAFCLTTKGLFTTQNFELGSGAQSPSWTQYVTAWPGNTQFHNSFCGDPALGVYISNGATRATAIWRLKLDFSSSWTQVLTGTEARTLTGIGGTGSGEFTGLYADKITNGKIYVVWQDQASTSSPTQVWLIKSTDYGDNWSAVLIMDTSGYTYNAGGGVFSRNDNVFVASASSNVSSFPAPTGTTRISESTVGGGSWSHIDKVGTMNDAELCTVVGSNTGLVYLFPNLYSNAYNGIMRGNGSQISDMTADNGENFEILGSNARDLPYNGGILNHAMVYVPVVGGTTGILYTTDEGWTENPQLPAEDKYTLSPAIGASIVHFVPDGAAWKAVLLGNNSLVSGTALVGLMQNYQSTSWDDRTGDMKTVDPTVTRAIGFSLGEVPVPVVGIYTHSVELRGAGTETGIALHGDRGVWNTDDYASEHAKDISDSTPKVHLPLATGGDSGKFVKYDGSKYILESIAVSPKQQVIFTLEGFLSVVSNPLKIYNKMGAARTIVEVFLAVGTAPTGADVIVDVHKNGTTIFTTQTNRPKVLDGATTGTTTTVEVPSWADGDYLTVDVDQIGSTTPGANLTVHIIYQ